MSEDNSKSFSIYKKDRIIYCICPPDIIDVGILKDAIKRRIELAEGKPHPIFIDATDVKYWTLESRKYGLSKEAHQCAKAYGVLINSTIIRTIVNWTFKMFPTTIPQKIFTSEEDAVQWLQKYVDREQGLKQYKPLFVL